MAKYKEITVDLKVTPELILEQLLVGGQKRVEPAQSGLQIKNKTKAENEKDSNKTE